MTKKILDNRYNIAISSPVFYPSIGGSQVFVHNLARNLQDVGNEVTVFIPFRNWLSVRSDEGKLPYRVFPLPPLPNSVYKNFPSLFLKTAQYWLNYYQQSFEFDIWHSKGTFPMGSLISYFTSGTNIPHIITIHGSDIQTYKEFGYGYRLDQRVNDIIKKYSAQGDHIVALTESNVPDCKEIGFDPKDISVIPGAIDKSRFDSIPVSKDEVRNRYNIPVESFNFIVVGRNHPIKSFDTVIHALNKIGNKIVDDLHVTFVGSDFEGLKAIASDQEVVQHVTFIDEIKPNTDELVVELPPEDLIRLYKASDACIVPSVMESFGIVNIEAMAAGIPLINSDARGCRDIVDHNINGLQFSRGNPKELARLMVELQNTPELATKLRDNARATLQANYLWSIVTEEYQLLYGEHITRFNGRV